MRRFLLVLVLGCGVAVVWSEAAGAEKGVVEIPARQKDGPEVTVVFEAEDYLKITPVMELGTDNAKSKRGKDPDLHLASGGKYLEIPDGPEDRNPNLVSPDNETGSYHKENRGGSAEYKLVCATPGDYYIWVRVWWSDGCGNSLKFSIDGSPPKVFTGKEGTYKVWQWAPILPEGMNARPYHLSAGEHRFVLSHSEDGIKFDQIFITTDSKKVPQGIEH